MQKFFKYLFSKQTLFRFKLKENTPTPFGVPTKSKTTITAELNPEPEDPPQDEPSETPAVFYRSRYHSAKHCRRSRLPHMFKENDGQETADDVHNKFKERQMLRKLSARLYNDKTSMPFIHFADEQVREDPGARIETSVAKETVDNSKFVHCSCCCCRQYSCQSLDQAVKKKISSLSEEYSQNSQTEVGTPSVVYALRDTVKQSCCSCCCCCHRRLRVPLGLPEDPLWIGEFADKVAQPLPIPEARQGIQHNPIKHSYQHRCPCREPTSLEPLSLPLPIQTEYPAQECITTSKTY